tara:strand:- start:17 stop:499 length:483 start_codon:yes stop_codon:yes gene_type:complete
MKKLNFFIIFQMEKQPSKQSKLQKYIKPISEVSTQDSFEKVIKKGENLIETNDFFRDLSDIMEDDKFSKFFNKYFIDSNEVKVTMIYMKLYNAFKEKWKGLSSEELDKRINIFLVWKIMKDRSTSKFAIHTIMEHLNKPKDVDILEELKQFIAISDNYLI